MDKENNAVMLGDSRALAEKIVSVLLEKGGLDVRMYYVRESSSITDYYVNVTGRSTTQVSSLADELVYKISLSGRDARKIEGKRGNSWLLVDYGDVIVNVFDRESRDFYNLDRLMPEDSEIDISDIVAEVDKKLDINNREV